MAAPILGMTAAKAGGLVIQEMQRPIIGYKKVTTRGGTTRERAFQVTGWQLLAAAMVGGVALSFYWASQQKNAVTGLPWPLSELINAVKAQGNIPTTLPNTLIRGSTGPGAPGTPEPFPILGRLFG